MKLDLKQIRIDGGTQPRAAIQPETVKEYAAAMADGAKFPAVVVYYDGDSYWLADGFHRLHAARHLELKKVEVEVRQGSLRDAILCSVGANATHGLRRSNDDKRRAVDVLLRDEEWSQWSDREIARRVGVSHPLVAALRPALSGNGYQIETDSEAADEAPETVRRAARGGTEYRIDTTRIGSGKRGPAVGGFSPDVDSFYDDAPSAADPDFAPAFGARREPDPAEVPAADPYDLGGLESVAHRSDGLPEAHDRPTWPTLLVRGASPAQREFGRSLLAAVTSAADEEIAAGNRKGAFRRAIRAVQYELDGVEAPV